MGFWGRMLSGHGGGHHGGGHGGGYSGWGRGGHDGSRNDGNGNGSPPAPTTPVARAVGLDCPACRAFNATNARFCQQCGTSLLPAACSGCQAALPPGAKFCQQCGAAT
ncbi:double zinc ribbon domain-containing protein [Paraburkholderia fungorum]|uniref:double zinc ribbon domain-containing protein n=1 Tax=Paraburkholderia fungorum TaxID=134537 RepID=UPI0038B931F7